VPSDQTDQNLDQDGTLDSSIAAIQSWLRGQTGGAGLKIDTSGGQPDITFVRLPRSDADYGSQQFILDAIAQDLRGAGLVLDPNKIYSIFYEGSAPGPSANVALCGLGGRNGLLAVALVFMHDQCGYDLNASRAGTTSALEFVLLHETIHAIGFVPDCAPHSTHEGHVSDNPQDLMSQFLPSAPVLDVNHDDYFQAHIAGCPDLSQSRYLEGAGITLTFAVGGDCPTSCTASFDSGQPVVITVSATADAGYRFVRWQGACTGASPTCALHASTSQNVTAIFEKAPPPALTVSVSGGGRVGSTPGGISCPSQCSARFAPGSTVQVRAHPQPGWHFVGWSGACNGRVRCNLHLTEAARLRATFRRG
jgi:hypothetical protein